MKKIIAVVCVLAVVLTLAATHVVKVETRYRYINGPINFITGKSTVEYEKIETTLSGKVISSDNGRVIVDYTAEMMVFDNEWTTTKLVVR